MAKILVVEDDPQVLDLLARVAGENGHTVVRARNGAEALTRLEPPPDVIVADIAMPGMTGVDFVCQMRGYPTMAQTPVIFVTSHPERSLPLQATGRGAQAVLAKPFHL